MADAAALAMEEANLGTEEGGLPIGSVLMRHTDVVGRGRNRWVQTGDPTAHAEMEAIRDAARLGADFDAIVSGATIYTTMMPCEMCAGAIIRFEIARVVVVETRTYTHAGTSTLMERQGIVVEVIDDTPWVAYMERWLEDNPELASMMRARNRKTLVL